MVKLKARLEPLKGKYYGSTITLYDDNGDITEFEIWVMGDYTPSERELADDPEFEVCDSHFESKAGYELCQTIVKAINGEAEG